MYIYIYIYFFMFLYGNIFSRLKNYNSLYTLSDISMYKYMQYTLYPGVPKVF